MLLVGVPSGLSGIAGTASASSVDVDRQYVVGVGDMSVSTLNPNVYTTTTESILIFSCYSTLLQYDEDSNVIGDLARSWSCSDDGLTWHFDIYDSAYFCDPANPMDTSHRVTASDVEFSFMSLQNEDGSRLHTYFPGIIKSFDIINDFEFTITLNGPFATIMGSWLGAPILPLYYWAGEDFTMFENTPPIGSGAYYYSTDGLPTFGVAILKKSPVWHMIEARGWSLRVDSWVLKEELSMDVAWMDIKYGMVDILPGVNPSVYTANLVDSTTPDVVGYSQTAGFVYEFNLNQMSDELRASLGGQYKGGSNNQLLLDPVVKMAMSCCIDKNGFVDDVLLGLGSYADSLVPPQNSGHYWYPDPDPYDPAAARAMLYAAGWTYRLDGTLIESSQSDYSTYYPLCNVGGTDPLRFNFITLDSDVLWTVGAKYIVNNSRQAGFDLQAQLMSTTDMNAAWFAADYDVWLWDWVMGVNSEAVSIMEVFSSEAIGTDQDVFWVNETFDDIYHEALVTMDPAARHEMADQLQALAYEMRGCNCLAYRDELYAASTLTWTNLGDLDSKYMLLPDVCNLWIALNMYPNENHAPDLFSYSSDVHTDVGVATAFIAGAVDDDPATVLEYRWFWGDGTSSAWSTSSEATHAYLEQGVYTADVAVREASASNGFLDNFVTSESLTVSVYDPDNAAPTDLAIAYSPVNPCIGTTVEFVGSAYDPDGDPLEFTWDFGDGQAASGATVQHVYTADGTYVVEMSVTDNVLGLEPRPMTDSVLICVAYNDPPTISVPDFDPVAVRTEGVYSVSAADPDGDPLSFTWDWGDGTVSYTATAMATHTYEVRGFYTVTVTVSDGTGLPGHEVSDSGTVYAYSGSMKHQHSGK
jgi:peptide/nickel transport system substrate-binding protein